MSLKDKRGISPVIATVLLIAIVVVIAVIIFLWFNEMSREAITKFSGKNIELVCDDVDFDASYSNGELYISNLGNVPIFGMKIKISGEGSYETVNLGDISNEWPSAGLDQGGTFSGDISSEVSGAEEIVLIPVLIGTSNKGEKTYMCEERHGYELLL
ncbi:MAG: hypothetical protein KKF68_00470 [Nanoarchaeota archaeon]|nr:hypothetical protein [Nanoarchaeota archaeon]